jgi:hypothetical protein
MKKSELKFIREWEETKKLGLFRFIMSNGIAWCIIMSPVLVLTDVWYYELSFFEVLLSKETLEKVIISLVVGVFLYGPVIWWLKGYYYNKFKKKLQNEQI